MHVTSQSGFLQVFELKNSNSVIQGVESMDYHEMMELGDELDQQFDELVKNCLISGEIDQGLYQKYDVKRGLRDANGKGVLTGLTEISDVLAVRQDENGVSHPIDGELYFQGINVVDLIGGNAQAALRTCADAQAAALTEIRQERYVCHWGFLLQSFTRTAVWAAAPANQNIFPVMSWGAAALPFR